MAKLIYAAITSLDGYVNDKRGKFEWAAPSEEVHAYVNDLERGTGTHLYGRKLYEVMRVWDDPATVAKESQVMKDFASVWRAAEKIVYSSTLASVSTAKTRLEKEFDVEAVRAMKSSAAKDLSVGGPGLAANAIRAGLVDEVHQFVTPIIVGGGTWWLPSDVWVKLELVGERRFGDGVVHLHYRLRA